MFLLFYVFAVSFVLAVIVSCLRFSFCFCCPLLWLLPTFVFAVLFCGSRLFSSLRSSFHACAHRFMPALLFRVGGSLSDGPLSSFASVRSFPPDKAGPYWFRLSKAERVTNYPPEVTKNNAKTARIPEKRVLVPRFSLFVARARPRILLSAAGRIRANPCVAPATQSPPLSWPPCPKGAKKSKKTGGIFV